MRLALALALAAGAVAVPLAAGAPAARDVLPPPVARPNPVLLGLRLDYVNPLPTPTGGVATLSPLVPAATEAAFADQRYLQYRVRDDLGGFVPARVGAAPLASGGRDVVGVRPRRPELPLFAQAAGGGIQSYTFTGGGAVVTPPENGRRPVPGLGTPPVVPPPTGGNTPPPPNQGFGGRPAPPPTTTATTATTTTTPPTTTRRKPPPPTTTTPTTTTTTTTTTTSAPPPTPPGNGSGTCGVAGVAITSDLSGCRIVAVNMAPGDGTFETLTIRNTSGSRYTLSLRATGTQNRLWGDLRMGVWQRGTAAPNPLPPLLDWTTQYNDLTTLDPGDSVSYEVELFLPTSAGNADQDLAAVIDFSWRATG